MKSVLIKNQRYNLKYDYYANEDGSIYSSISNKILNWQKDKDGYAKVQLISSDGKRHRYSVHRLILENFNPIPNMKKCKLIILTEINGTMLYQTWNGATVQKI